jgi:GMP synthase (glutamine-hydrolysing)
MAVFYVVECGGQHTDLIMTRLQHMGYKSRIIPTATDPAGLPDAAGFILSGGPKSVDEKGSYRVSRRMLESGVPVMGICYGQQTIVKELGGDVCHGAKEYGESRLRLRGKSPLFEGCEDRSVVWNNHGDAVRNVEGAFGVLGETEKGIIAAVKAKGRDIYAVQFHPELTHTRYGTRMLENFARRICKTEPEPVSGFDAGGFIDEAVHKLRSEVGGRALFLLLSGGVDSTVCMAIAKRAGVKVLPAHLDMGVERYMEAETVKNELGMIFDTDVLVHYTGDWAVPKLAGYRDPIERRMAFRDVYKRSALEALERLGAGRSECIFGQGTLATDKRESGKSAASGSEDGGGVANIKPHHNVEFGLPVVEILGKVSKGEVRKVAAELRLPRKYVEKWPFPGPGLSVRLMTDYCECGPGLSEGMDSVARTYGFRGFALPFKSIGIKGDGRSFEHVAVIYGSSDRPDWKAARAASKAAAEELPINRTLYRWGSSPGFRPEDLQDMAPLEFTHENLRTLREATYIAESVIERHSVRCAQVPVSMHPGPGGHWITVRDFDTVDFRSGRPLDKPDEMPFECCEEIASGIMALKKIAGVCFDASTKPAATTEMV